MKVIIQDSASRQYLSAAGRWVMNKHEAGDFLTLLRAYHFARINTSRGFEVLLYCPEDDYSASIITGIGISDANTPTAPEPVEIKINFVRTKVLSQSGNRWSIASRLDEAKNYLN